jgi:protein-S-isoprenylcysteine O-methyltransferase Ste14
MKMRWLEVGDFLGRLGLGVYFSVAASQRVIGISRAVYNWNSNSGETFLKLLVDISVLAFALIAIGAVVFRLRPLKSADGLAPRLTALAGTFLLFVLILIPTPPDLPQIVTIFALALLIAGSILSAYVLSWLGKSYSIMAQARKLVTGGPYRIVRHPLYLTEEIGTIGLILLNWSWKAVLVGVIHWCVQLRRMHNEEKVLRQVFADYDDYAQHTPRIIPRLGLLWPRLVPRN